MFKYQQLSKTINKALLFTQFAVLNMHMPGLTNLTNLDLKDNPLPVCLLGLLYFNLAGNQLSGEFLALPNLNLETLFISWNKFTGLIPTLFGNPHKLKKIYAKSNLFNSIPAAIKGSMFGDDKSDVISDSGFHACLRCGTSDESEGSTKCLRCMEAVSEGFSGFDSEEGGLESLNLEGSVQGLFDDEYSYSESDEGSFNGFENTTDTESSSSDFGVDSEESWGTTDGDVEGDSLSHQFVSVTSFFHEGKELNLKSWFELTEGELVVGVAMPLQYEKAGSVTLLGEDCVESSNPPLRTDSKVFTKVKRVADKV
ncbi:hypothetical protein HDU77_011784 [Chytriomyces hyalinus]|nr:hypothetical protein HDU77_011784 [Chytriomyces hyalinus]